MKRPSLTVEWYRPQLEYRTTLCFLVLSLCVALSSAVRFHQYDVWLETPLQYFAAEIPMMADYDAYYWLRWAREYQEGIFYDNKDGLRFYPDGDTKPELTDRALLWKNHKPHPTDCSLLWKNDKPNRLTASCFGYIKLLLAFEK